MRLYLSSFRLGNKPEEMLSLTTGRRAAVIANAADMKTADDRSQAVKYEIEVLSGLGFDAEEVDLRLYFVKQNELKAAIANFDYIWVRGGNVFLLRKAFRQSGFDILLTKLMVEDKVAYGGYSAGICILSPSLHGLEIVDPLDLTVTKYQKEILWDGLNLLPYSIAPHYRSEHPESADVEKCVDYFKANDVPFKTLRDGEAIVINGDDVKLVN